MSEPDTFRYLGVELDLASSSVSCSYEVGGEEFTEVAAIPGGDLARPGAHAAAELYFLLAGVSYYKVAAPRRIDLGGVELSDEGLGFLRRFYLEGLGEFSLTNGLDLSGLEIEGAAAPRRAPVGAFDPGQLLIPFGGGLDSIVTVSELGPRAERAALFVAERPGARFAALEAAAAVTGLEVVRAERGLDDKVLASAARGYLNGHVPVTGVLSALGVLTAVAHGFGALAMSNERSASSASTQGPSGPVNHQWSKGADFEDGFRALVGERLTGFEYFSWLRDRSELSIAASFASLPEYHRVFRSCNRAFHQDPGARLADWCGVCDKCLFIDLVLAPALEASELRAIFSGREPIENEALADQLRVLVGLGEGPRPFECVGDEAECREALLLAAARPDRADSRLLQELAARTPLPEAASEAPRSAIPERYAPRARLV
jgi:hypothetical protein